MKRCQPFPKSLVAHGSWLRQNSLTRLNRLADSLRGPLYLRRQQHRPRRRTRYRCSACAHPLHAPPTDLPGICADFFCLRRSGDSPSRSARQLSAQTPLKSCTLPTTTHDCTVAYDWLRSLQRQRLVSHVEFVMCNWAPKPVEHLAACNVLLRALQ